MSESPERKVLKETIGRLKTKNITAITNHMMAVKAFNETWERLFNSFKEQYAQASQQDKKMLDLVFVLLGVVAQDFQKIISSSFGTIDDMKLYADTLESYSIELDNTLTAIFAQAKKYAEEKTKEQEALTLKKPDSSYVK